jgi:3-hydroxyisobutyrate dehydrogenase-like beta-hydroxyacid dehydrogenase
VRTSARTAWPLTSRWRSPPSLRQTPYKRYVTAERSQVGNSRHFAWSPSAPFTGSKPAAEQRAIIAFLGGETPALDLVEPVLSRISAKRVRVGLPQHAAALKLSMNLQIAIVTEALAEGLAFARGSGIPDDIFFEVLTSNPACSGLVALKGPKLRSADFSPQFSVKHLLKALRLVLDIPTARRLPATTLLAEQLQLVMNEGGADEDFSALFKLLKSNPISPQ